MNRYHLQGWEYLLRLPVGLHIAQHGLFHFLHAFSGGDITLDPTLWSIDQSDVGPAVIAENLEGGAALRSGDMRDRPLIRKTPYLPP